ncbi:hypothetical protein PspLS_10244 [Pyricularia sp. CBS 133598]|nr:hypothetical protein PspLS_10244 [Pyricularia sp. CBS 133598]
MFRFLEIVSGFCPAGANPDDRCNRTREVWISRRNPNRFRSKHHMIAASVFREARNTTMQNKTQTTVGQHPH